ncbi:hypothetical protein SLA2020_294510 [Shorea laevis]
MEKESSSSELQRLMEAIKSSEVVEGRIELIAKLEKLHLSEKFDLASLFDCLTVSCSLHHYSTCLDVCQCMLNNTILHVAAKYLDSDISGCFAQLLLLGVKASIWCGKHLKMTLMSTGGSQEEEEHGSIFFKLLLDVLNFTATICTAITRSCTLDDEVLKIVEKFILEQLDMIRNAISEIKKISSIGGEVLRAAQIAIEAVIKLCKEYLQVVKWELSDLEFEKEKMDINCQKVCIINITMVTIEKLFELGILAANDGGSLVTILNVSWKGVVTLLQLGKGKLSWKGKVAEIIKTLISLVNESLKCAAELWSSSLKDTVSVAEARRTCIPVKFYLINAVKICSLYPCQGFQVFRDLALSVLTISAFKLLLSNEKLLKNASEMVAELLEKTSFDLLSSLLNSGDVKQEQKYGLVDFLFIDDSCLDSVNGDPVKNCMATSMDEIFSVNLAAMSKVRVLLPSRVALFITFLRYSSGLEEDVNLLIARKLDWFLQILIDEEIYSFILVSHIPVSYVSGKTVDLVWEPTFSALLNALKTFMIVVPSTLAWGELESFLLENFFHPHCLCWDIIMELWCFLVRHAEREFVIGIIDKLCALMMFVSSSESVHFQGSALRKIARSICMLITFGSPSAIERVYRSVVSDEGSQLLVPYVALLLEGFPLNLLQDSLRSIAKEKIITDYFGLIDSFDDKLLDVTSFSLGVPVFALSASLQSLQVSLSDIDKKTVKFLVTVILGYRNSADKLAKDSFCKLLAEGLGIISNISHIYAPNEMEEVILELQDLFVSGKTASDVQLSHCKPQLALYMAALSQMVMSESDNCAASSATWALYHMLLRDRHWAFVHLAIASFGYFAARTNCNQLWRFVPQNAALSYDLVAGNEASEERFMSEFKAFLEKEMPLLTVTPSYEQVGMLMEEGLVLKGMVQKIANMNIDVVQCESMGIDSVDGESQSNKRRKLPDGIGKGVELLQNGLRVIGESLTQWQPDPVESAELHEKFLTHFSSLEDAISNIVGLQGSG